MSLLFSILLYFKFQILQVPSFLRLIADPKGVASIILRGGLGTQLFGVCSVKFEALERGSDRRRSGGEAVNIRVSRKSCVETDL